MAPAGTSNELDVQNKWEENTHKTHVRSKAATERWLERKVKSYFLGNVGCRDKNISMVFIIYGCVKKRDFITD